MSWLNSLLPFAGGFLKGFYENYTRPEPAYSAPPSGGSDFQSRMIAFGQATGLGTPTFRNRSAAFSVPTQGMSYLVVLTARKHLVIASACSQVEFRYGVPRELLPAIRRLNAGITSGCRYEVAEDENGASLCTTTECGLHELTLPVFDALLTELTHRIAALDRVLMENGYGR